MSMDVLDAPICLAPAAPPLRATSRALRALQSRTSPAVSMLTETAAEPAGRACEGLPIDLACLSRRLSGRGEVIRKTLSLFDEECERGMDELRRRIDSADLDGAAESAHRLKGAAGTVAAHGLRESAARVEDACRHRRTADVVAEFAELEQRAVDVMDYLHKVL